jgi:hypothetical protein
MIGIASYLHEFAVLDVIEKGTGVWTVLGTRPTDNSGLTGMSGHFGLLSTLKTGER